MSLAAEAILSDSYVRLEEVTHHRRHLQLHLAPGYGQGPSYRTLTGSLAIFAFPIASSGLYIIPAHVSHRCF